MTSEDASSLFLEFARAKEFKDVIHNFSELVSELHIPQRDFHHVYNTLKVMEQQNYKDIICHVLMKKRFVYWKQILIVHNQ